MLNAVAIFTAVLVVCGLNLMLAWECNPHWFTKPPIAWSCSQCEKFEVRRDRVQPEWVRHSHRSTFYHVVWKKNIVNGVDFGSWGECGWMRWKSVAGVESADGEMVRINATLDVDAEIAAAKRLIRESEEKGLVREEGKVGM